MSGALGALVIVFGLAARSLSPASAAPEPGPIQAEYAVPGPSAVTVAEGLGCCSSTGRKFDVWYPTDLGGTPHPIITFGDGSDAQPAQYAFLLAHLASWGYVVVASESGAVGTGREQRDAAAWMIGENTRAGSVFRGHLNTRAVAAVGHSQGATGSMNALADAPSVISTVVTLELPAQLFCSSAANCADARRLTSGSVFYINGSLDGLSPSTQLLPPALIGQSSAKAYYDATPAQLPKVAATVVGPDHNDVQGQPECAGVPLCREGVSGYLGYLTAWLPDRLRQDSAAHAAFVAGTGELMTAPGWSHRLSNVA